MDFSNIEIKKLPRSYIEVTAEIPSNDFDAAYDEAIKEFSGEVEMPGFRKGHIPEAIIREKVGEGMILERAAKHAIEKFYAGFLEHEKIEAIGRPEVTVTKIARKNPLIFTIQSAVLPEISLPDYRSIAKEAMLKKESIIVEEKEVDDMLSYLQKSRAKQDNKETEETLSLPDDEFAKKVGSFKTLEELKTTLRENIKEDKILKAREKKRLEVLEAIMQKTTIDIPDIMIDSEKEKMLGELRSSVEQMGMQWQDYLLHVKKSEEELKKGWKEEAKKRVSYGLILSALAKQEHIEVLPTDIDEYVRHIESHYPAADQKKVDSNRLHQYAYGIIRNEKVFQLLESYSS